MCCIFKASYSRTFFPIYDFNFIPWRQMFSFSFHILSATPDLSISLRYSPFRFFSCYTFRRWGFSTLPQLQGMKYTQFLVLLYSVEGLTRKRYIKTVIPLLNIVLASYGLNILKSSWLGLCHRAERLWWVFRYYSLSFGPNFLEPILYSQ